MAQPPPETRPHPDSPRLDHCPQTLPREAYLDPAWYQREMQTIFAQQWVMVGRLADLAPGTMRGVKIGEAPVLLARTSDGNVSAFHNSCRHRGAELCGEGEERRLGKLITCRYHAWGYGAQEGRLVTTGHAVPTADFDKGLHGLRRVNHRIWNDFLFLSLSPTPGQLLADVELSVFDNWPVADLVTGHRWETEIACNWKAFWENYSECLHCPGIHPELSQRVPVYGRGLMAPNEALDWSPDQAEAPPMQPGTASWTPSGAACGPEFTTLSPQEQAEGYRFATLWPSCYIVGHSDHMRSVRIIPLSPSRTRLVAEWYFPQETMAQAGFDAAAIASFATLVMSQDGAASEMNQRGIASPGFTHGRLMPEEYEIHRFHQWLLREMGLPTPPPPREGMQ